MAQGRGFDHLPHLFSLASPRAIPKGETYDTYLFPLGGKYQLWVFQKARLCVKRLLLLENINVALLLECDFRLRLCNLELISKGVNFFGYCCEKAMMLILQQYNGNVEACFISVL